ncbi:putative DNA repair protein [Candidatus Kinetoplastibacterium blastocrithidii TCC012E]|uniref:Putative DNA repair protein n=1 Tax=Candidatus Kinetoplastidibacterium blastocrithidiae TCC012E TaxID=1208922 RepID=M1LVK1_9PROT|nr:PD-(D/E)XK nuclease family protein [Candidatus Kinetoplastibacterium blastocrithidii]AFZ83486.1 hypothetical protein CKBE_00297 [Candidatus Kinetoplastibacterium blastocrithidii (ex Strigomonas culicis)]AGF49582.1 putative DNA repair protein [Candidatus Kinetoplastibacterium blastocrithidii TCC012E]
MQIEELDLCKIDLESVCSMIPSKSLLLTANKRQANQIMKYLSEYLCFTKETKEVMQVVSLDDWMVRLFEYLSFSQIELPSFFLNKPSMRILWRNILKKDSISKNYSIESNSLSILALDAYEIINNWMIRFPKGFNSLECDRFIHWNRCYKKELNKLNAIDANGIYSIIIRSIEKNRIILPESIVLSGFTEYSPRINKLLKKILSKNTKLYLMSNEVSKSSSNRYLKCNNIIEEWRSAAIWMADSFIKNPSGRYAIVSAQIDKHAEIAYRTLGHILRYYRKEFSITFSISYEKSAIQVPIIHSAFLWLDILVCLSVDSKCNIKNLGETLLSSYSFMGNRLFEPFSILEIKLRDKIGTCIDIIEISELLKDCNLGIDFLTALSIWPKGDSLLMISRWIKIIRKSLFFICFSRYVFSDEAVNRALELFDSLLNEFNVFSGFFGNISADRVISLFKSFVEFNRFYQYENSHKNIEVLDLLEVGSRSWDAIWIIGFNDGVLPGLVYSNPFLPKDIAHKFPIPHSSREYEYDWSYSIYKSVNKCAKEFIVSYSSNENGVVMEPSPFIDDSYQELNIMDYRSLEEKVPMEYINDSKGPRLLPSESVINGANVLELQSRNPLWAFAKYRLGIKSLEPYYKDKNTLYKRGRFLHRVLELFWLDVRCYSKLIDLSDDAIESLLLKYIEDALSINLYFDQEFIRQLESERALKLLINWINIEKGRLPFLVNNVEDNISWKYKSLVFNMRLDRIDLFKDKAIIIDYKTGRNILNIDLDWDNRQRPINLQLALYHMAFSQINSVDVLSLVIVSLRANGILMSGISSEDFGLPGIRVCSDFDSKIRDLFSKVLMLADEYAEGVSTNFVVKEDDIKFCDITPFLRINFNK